MRSGIFFSGNQDGSPTQSRRIAAALTHPDGDWWDEIAPAWMGKDLVRHVYAAVGFL